MPDVSSGTVAPPSRRVTGPDAAHGSLPRPLTSFIGRERELAQARRLLQDSYLVTLTGPGGSGKTRLCIALAAQVAAEYPDGVYFVPLAPVRDPGLVPSTIAQSIGLHDARDRPLMEHLVSQLRERQMLIVLDNFEHLLAGAPVVTRDGRQPPRFRNDGTGPVVLVRPDGHVAARGRPGSLHPVTGYLRDLFQAPACDLSGEHPAEGAPRALSDTAANQ